MGGGGGKQPRQPVYRPVEQPEIKPVPQAQIQDYGWGGIGWTPVQNPYTQQGMPDWMRGETMNLFGQGYQGMPGMSKAIPNWYQMPQWGTNATTGAPLQQRDLNS
jgi:hypothetical protein